MNAYQPRVVKGAAVAAVAVAAILGGTFALRPTSVQSATQYGPAPSNAIDILWADYCGRVADPACALPSASLAPSASVGPTAAPSVTAAPSATPTPTPAPTPVPTPPATGGDFILIAKSDLMALPTSGAAWSGVLSWAAKTPDVDLSNLDSNGDVITLAKALVYARTGDTTKQSEVVATLGKAMQSKVARALELARGVGAYVLAADLVGYRDPAFVAWAKAQRSRPVTGGPSSIDVCANQRPNNWGGWCRSSRLIIDLYTGDTADVTASVVRFRGWLGDRSQYVSYLYGDTSWQADPSKPVGINPVGATKSGHNIDGAVPDDQRRAGSFTWPPPCENYVSEMLQSTTLEAIVLARTGLPSWTWSDSAIKRAVEFKYANGCAFTGDDSFIPFVTDSIYGTHHAGSAPAQPGKGSGFYDWLFG